MLLTEAVDESSSAADGGQSWVRVMSLGPQIITKWKNAMILSMAAAEVEAEPGPCQAERVAPGHGL